MGFPPIGIMSLSSVIKQAGHECVLFDQANPDTPNAVIIDRINQEQPALVGLSFLSTTSYPYAKILAREIRATNQNVKLAFGGVFADETVHDDANVSGMPLALHLLRHPDLQRRKVACPQPTACGLGAQISRRTRL
ncbi:MAG: cobalamin B12-binding domain-containing protein [Nitrospira sp.]|nr:cobalamin B12-binding domain-containing protein [Nitrospira sp.]